MGGGGALHQLRDTLARMTAALEAAPPVLRGVISQETGLDLTGVSGEADKRCYSHLWTHNIYSPNQTAQQELRCAR